MAREHKLSIVITSRNDDFGAQMLQRFRLFLETLLELGDRHALDAEIIVVEWNPPEGPRLHDVSGLRVQSKSIPIRFIEVPRELHDAYPNSGALPLFQMIAKNVGVRRARGRFVLATNQDILLSEELIALLASEELEASILYRIDRHDVDRRLPDDLPVDARLQWCASHLIRIHARHGTYPHWQWVRANGIGAGWSEIRKQYSALRIAVALVRVPMRILGDQFREEKAWVHTNACGDFTLCAREKWLELRGYAELPIYSLHVDSLFCYSALGLGLRQKLLRPPCYCYHLDHESSWAVMGTEEKIRWFAEKPWLDTSVLQEAAQFVRHERRPLEINPPDWGFGDVELPEVTLLEGRVS